MNRKSFYDALRPTLGALTQANVAGFEMVLDEAERRRLDAAYVAYVLATAWWESGKTMAPVEEAYYLGSRANAYRRKLRYYPYHGRGLVQLTWKENYRKAGDVVGADLVNNPMLALDPKISVKILFDGMERGWFTGRKVSDYIDTIDESDAEDFREFREARRVVNGMDRASEIGHLAILFERALRSARFGGARPPIEPPAPPPPLPPEALPGFWTRLFKAFFP
jgi:putative chitinase